MKTTDPRAHIFRALQQTISSAKLPEVQSFLRDLAHAIGGYDRWAIVASDCASIARLMRHRASLEITIPIRQVLEKTEQILKEANPTEPFARRTIPEVPQGILEILDILASIGKSQWPGHALAETARQATLLSFLDSSEGEYSKIEWRECRTA